MVRARPALAGCGDRWAMIQHTETDIRPGTGAALDLPGRSPVWVEMITDLDWPTDTPADRGVCSRPRGRSARESGRDKRERLTHFNSVVDITFWGPTVVYFTQFRL